MAICTICCEGDDPVERGPGGEPLCPACARLLLWFWGHFADVLIIPKEGFFKADTMFLELGADSLDFVEWLLEAGYQGTFDCELNGPDIDAMGHSEAAAQSARWLDALLTRLGA